MIGLLIKWLTGSGLQALADIYAKGKDSAVETERIHADLAKRQLDNALEAQRLAQQVRLATAGFWEMRLLTFLIALPFVVHLLLVGADTCFKLGLRIPAYPHPFDEWEGAIVLSFFGIATVGKGITAVAAGFLARR
jgi:hypothetical protein